MRWPWQRRPETRVAARGPAPSPAPPTRPRGQWRRLEPLRPAVATTMVSAAEPLGFVRTLPSRWQVPPALAPLGHDVTVTAPAARVPVAGAPVGGYPDPPELVWAAAPPPASEGPADPGPRLPPRAAPPTLADLPVPAPDRPLDPGAAGPASPAPLAATATATASTPPRPSSRLLAGTREPLPAHPFRPAQVVDPRTEPTGPPEVAAGPVATQGHRVSAPTDVAPDGPRRPVLDLGETGTAAAAPGRAEAGEDTGAVPPGPARGVVLPQAPTGHQAAGPAVPPAEPSVGEPAAPVGARPVPSPAVLQVRPVVGLRPALVTAPSRGTAAVQDLATAAPALDGPALHEHVTPPIEAPTGPGTAVPEWFSSGPIRTVLPEPDAVVAAEPRAAAASPAPLPSAPRRQPPQGEVTPPPPARAAAAAVPHAPRRVAWPASADTAPEASIAVAAHVGDTDDDPTAPHDAVDVADGGPAVDLDAPVASRRDPAQPEAPSRLRPDTTAAPTPPTPPSPAAARPRTDAAPIAAGPRRFRVGAPLPRPAPARAPARRTGLAELAAAAMAAVAHEPGADTAPRAGRRDDAPDLAAGGTPPPRGLLPSDLGLPGRVDTPSAPTATTVSDARNEDEDDLGPAAGPSIDEIYEQVRDRLRHELVVDRERAALLAD